jgi:hypothetical protein
MKLINLQSLLLPVIGWFLDFQNDNNRLPESLDDLTKNKSEARDYDPARVMRRNGEQGYIINYSLSGKSTFELKINKDNACLIYKSLSNTLQYYQDNELKYEQVLS